MSERREIILHYRTTEDKLPDPEKMEVGEIAMSTCDNDPKLYIKKNNGEIAVFAQNKVGMSSSFVLNDKKLYFSDDDIYVEGDTLYVNKGELTEPDEEGNQTLYV